MVLVSSVTAPFRANSRPRKVAWFPAEMEVRASTSPTNSVPLLKVAELPTCHTMLHGLAPFTRRTRLLTSVMSVVPTWNTNMASGSPCASRVRVPVRPNVPPVYTPGSRGVGLASSTAWLVAGVRPAASL
jgi:hypothetical protein